jgi:ribosomal protein S18 acetylase RimI-like enzyme
MDMKIEQMKAQDYGEIVTLWNRTEGIGLSGADNMESIESFLKRNPGLSFVLRNDGRIVGTIMAGHDGRRGYLYHLVVVSEYRGEGWGRKLVRACLAELLRQGIQKCHLFVYKRNTTGREFWKISGWTEREDIQVFSKEL